jgi:hypothetical protein
LTSGDVAASSSASAPTGRVHRPLGLTFLAVVLAWAALQAPSMVFEPSYSDPPLKMLLIRTTALINGVTAAVACVGLWKVRPWGYHAFIAWAAIAVIGALLISATDIGTSSSDRLQGLAVAAAVFVPLALYVKRRTDQVQASQYVKRTPYQAGRLQVVFGFVLVVPSVFFLHWLVTSPDAGYLMILGAMLGLGALLASIVGVTLIIGGLWTAYELPGRRWAHVIPLVAGIAIAGYLINQL